MAAPRDDVAFWAAAGILVAASAAAWALLPGGEPAAAPAPARAAAAPQEPVRISVASAAGRAFVVRKGVGGVPAAAGAELAPDDVLVTEAGARVELAAGERYRVILDGEGRVGIQEITSELSRFRLDAGLVSASVREDGARSLEIATARDAVARTRGGDLAVSRAGPVVAVGVRRGGAEFRSGGRTVALAAGEQSVAVEGKAPSSPAPIPASLLLKVAWPEERTTAQPRLVVTGRTTPGTLVAVGGERVAVSPDGSFTHVVALAEGPQRVAVSARDVAGRTEQVVSPTLVLDTRAPATEFDTRDLWKEERR
jgi:hypothetical protein